MNSHGMGQSFMALVDDDSHSARLMIRMLLAHGAPSVSWLNGEALASEELGKVLADSHATLPGLVIVDLKSSSTASADFIRKLRAGGLAAVDEGRLGDLLPQRGVGGRVDGVGEAQDHGVLRARSRRRRSGRTRCRSAARG